MDFNPQVLNLLGYSMGLLELMGTFANGYSVWLMARLRIATWPVGIIGSVLFAVLFFEIRLYGDFIEQIYYVGASIYGWIIWWRRGAHQSPPAAMWSSRQVLLITLVATVLISLLFGYFLSQIHIWFPRFFEAPAEFPFIDGLTTMASFVAMILMANCRIEAWIYWIVINTISIGLYSAKSVYFITLLYGIYLILAFLGYKTWKKYLRKSTQR